MYHMHFPKQTLGANEVGDPSPVGRRLAFDVAEGRLSVVTTSLARES